ATQCINCRCETQSGSQTSSCSHHHLSLLLQQNLHPHPQQYHHLRLHSHLYPHLQQQSSTHTTPTTNMKIASFAAAAAALVAAIASANAYEVAYSGLTGDIAWRLGTCTNARSDVDYRALEAALGSSCHTAPDNTGREDCMIEGQAKESVCRELKVRCIGFYKGHWANDQSQQICKDFPTSTQPPTMPMPPARP
ncbi:hypothetical protein GQ42DRAFT_170917, partial [Ramicandelaber brevisporus]